jgi:spore maturation protein CgeB
MTAQRVLFVGTQTGTSLHRANAFKRLGYDVLHLDPRSWLPASRYVDVWQWRTGGRFLETVADARMRFAIARQRFDLTWVDSGELVGPSMLRVLRSHSKWVVNYNVDDPFGSRDFRRWRLYLKSVPHYDMVVVVRDENVPEARAKGARKVHQVFRSADEVAHAPRALTNDDRRQWASDVLFVGTWMPERGPLVEGLLDRDVPITIFGGRWEKAPQWRRLKSVWRGPALDNEDDYAKAIQCAKICIGLVSEGNRDLHTQRSAEIPSIGGLLCAKRTKDHLAMYREGEEAVFWDDLDECGRLCSTLLADEDRRQRIATRGRQRCLASKYQNEAVIDDVLRKLMC